VYAEIILGFNLQVVVRDFYLSINGGSPEPYVFEDQNIDTIVAEFLPLKSERKGTVLVSYKRLVCEKKLVPRHFLPFAVDGGGDYFFVDCSTLDGQVYFYRSDSISSERLVNLNLAFKQFWSSLKVEN
jgi:hypothetical protein